MPGVSIARGHHGIGDLVQVRVGQDDQRAVAPQFHRHALEPCRLDDLLADLHAAGKADLSHALVAAQQLAELAAAAGEAGDRFWRQAAFQQDLDQL